MTDTTPLQVERHDAIAEIRLVRPDLLNRFDDELLTALGPVLLELADDEEIRAAVLSSTGKVFSAGGAFETILRANADLRVLLGQVDLGRRLFRTIADFPKPLVTALHGDVFGVATSLVLTSDAVVATPTVRLGDPHVHMGLAAGDGGCVMWPANLPLVKAKRHLLWGEPISAREAHDLGMVTDLVDNADDVRPRALELASQVSQLPPIAVEMTKRALNKELHARIDNVFDVAFYLEAISAQTSDVREAVAAFREDRPGSWSGR